MLCGLDQQREKKEDGGLYFIDQGWDSIDIRCKDNIIDETHASRYLVHPGADKTYYDLGDMHWWPCMKKDVATYVSNCLTCSKVKAETSKTFGSPVLWAEIGESRLIGPELVQETTDKVVLIKEKLKATRDRQKRYADNRRKPLEFEVRYRVLLKVSPWKGVIRFGKKDEYAYSVIDMFMDRIGTPTVGNYRFNETKEQKNDVKARSMLLMALPNEHLLTFNQYKDAKTLFAVYKQDLVASEDCKSAGYSR
ncbi:putative reverse transcriptase domain-containing protein [Tanacetum coccineum]